METNKTKNTDAFDDDKINDLKDQKEAKASTEFLDNEDHIEFIGSLLGDVFESEEEALAALSKIAVNGKRLINIDDLSEAVRIIKDAIAQGGIDAISVEVNGSFVGLQFPDYDTEEVKLNKKKKDKHNIFKNIIEPDIEKIIEPKAEAVNDDAKKDKAEEEKKDKPETSIEFEYPENDRTEDVYTYTAPEEFSLKYDTFSEDFLNNNVSGIVVLSRLSGLPLTENSGRDMLERAADRLYVNGMPAIMFYSMGKKEKLTEEDYNTLGTSIAATLKETFIDNKKGNFVMFRGEREDKFTAFTMGSDTLLSEEPQKVELYSGLKKVFSSPSSIEKNREEYNNYTNVLLPRYETYMKLKAMSSGAQEAALSIVPLDKIKRTSIEKLQEEKGIVSNTFKPTAPFHHLEEEDQMSKEPEIMAPGKNFRRNTRPTDNE